MENDKVWFITGAGRGMGVDIAKAALAAGHKVVATGRNPDKVSKALGECENLLVVKLDFTFCSAYAASKFGIDGWMESLQTEVEQFGIHTTIVNPGFFRTELLTEESTQYSDNPIVDYEEGRKQQLAFWKGANGQQTGDAAKLAKGLIKITEEQTPPKRFLAGADAVATAEQASDRLIREANAYRDLSSNMAFDQV